MRTLTNLLIRLAFLAGLALAAYFIVDLYAPARHVPWKPADLTQPPGLATGMQVQALGADIDQCLSALSRAGVEAEAAPNVDDGEFCKVENAVTIRSGVTRTSPDKVVMSCPLAAAYVIWDRQVLQPAARDILGSEVESVGTYGAFVCRRRYGRETEKPSEHARANAIDVGDFRLADGRRVTVKDGWFASGPEAVFLRRLRQGGCDVFGTVLGPDYNDAHHDHLHFDMGLSDFCPIGPAQADGMARQLIAPTRAAAPDAKAAAPAP